MPSFYRHAVRAKVSTILPVRSVNYAPGPYPILAQAIGLGLRKSRNPRAEGPIQPAAIFKGPLPPDNGSSYPREKSAVIVSQSFARRQRPHQNSIGQRLEDDGTHKSTVVGVAGDAHINAISDIFRPFSEFVEIAVDLSWTCGSLAIPIYLWCHRKSGPLL
jgi:hypothetical protein